MPHRVSRAHRRRCKPATEPSSGESIRWWKNCWAFPLRWLARADYPDEDIDEVSDENLRASVYEICGMLEGILKGYDNGRLLREGISTVIVGRPNVGKSTLMNLLSGEQKSIVTQIPGTTRDIVEDTIRLGEVVLHLADTAGLRDTDDPVERMGVELARKRLNSSYLVLAVFDSSEELSAEDLELIEKIKDRPVVAIINKSDLPRRIDIEKIREKIGKHLVQISASEGEGVQALEQEICRLLKLDQLDSSAGVIANERQRSCVGSAENDGAGKAGAGRRRNAGCGECLHRLGNRQPAGADW